MNAPAPTAADMLVAELAYVFGANFEISNSGPNGEARWTYEPEPGLRDAARCFLKGVDRHQNGPFDGDIIAAIRRIQSGGRA